MPVRVRPSAPIKSVTYGLNVTAVDIEPAYIEAIRRQCRALDVPIKAEVGAFGDLLDDRRYDAVLFFEAFHHCVRHNHLLQRIASALNRDGMIDSKTS